MIADKYIYAKLTANAGVSALIATRVYPIVIPQNAAFPAIAYSAIYTPGDHNKTQAATKDNCEFTIRSWAATYDAAAALDKAVRAALDYVDDGGEGETAGGVTVEVCEWLSSKDGMEEGASDANGSNYFFRESAYFIRERL